MIVRCYYRHEGAHVQARVFVGPEGRGALAGILRFRAGEEWAAFKFNCAAAIQFVEDRREDKVRGRELVNEVEGGGADA